MKEILSEVLELLERGQDFALVKLGAESGSTPRAAGAEMLVRRDGTIAGTIGGGLLELTMMKAAVETLERGVSQVTSLALSGTDLGSEEKMVCGGSADVLITYVPPGDPALLEVCRAVREAAAARRRAWLFTIVRAEGDVSVTHCLLDDDGCVVGAKPCEPGELRSAVGKLAVHGSIRLADGREVLVEPLGAPEALVICGAGHVARALAPVARGVGFDVTVIDDRAEFADATRFAGCHVVVSPFDAALGHVGVDENTYVVIVTRGHVHDMNVLEQALRTKAPYVGLMASRSKRARVFAALRETGIGEVDLARVRSPIGLEIGAETPAELAISIVAEMIKVRAGKAV